MPGDVKVAIVRTEGDVLHVIQARGEAVDELPRCAVVAVDQLRARRSPRTASDVKIALPSPLASWPNARAQGK